MSALERHGLLNDTDSPTPVTPPTAASTPGRPLSTRHRPGYARVPSVSFTNEAMARDITETVTGDDEEPNVSKAPASTNQGLGIAMSSTSSFKTPRISSPPIEDRSMTFNESFSGSTQYDGSFSDDISYATTKHAHKDSRTSLHSTAVPSISAKSDAGLLSVRSRYNEFAPHQHCRSRRSIKARRLGNWISVMVLVLAVFSTAFSAIFLVLALLGPNWGRQIRDSGGRFTPASAAFLTSFFAKLIELSFVTVVVAFIGQILARRALEAQSPRGITLAEMSMRTWIMQPGTLLTQFEYAGLSVLGVFSLLAALAAILYTSAATALVQPQLRFPGWSSRVQLRGFVKTEFANPIYLEKSCKTPIQPLFDPPLPDGSNPLWSTCLQIEHAAMAFHNYQTWMSTWTDNVNNGTASKYLSERPKGYALYNDNTTLTNPWIEIRNVTAVNGTRYVNNVTMAVPHVGVAQARQDPYNNLLQPDEVGGSQVSTIASVASPMVNVLCVTMTYSDLKPFVYSLWDNFPKKTFNISGWPHNYGYHDPYLGTTQFDDIFGWGVKYGPMKYPPVFPMVPADYNTLLNDTLGVGAWGRQTIYLLGKGGEQDWQGSPLVDSSGMGTNYALCQLQAGISTNCSTHYNASSSGATMEAVCEDRSDPYQYFKSDPSGWNGNASVSQDWPNIAGEWARSLSLSAGVDEGNASIARLLTQFIVTQNELNTALPSMAEALAVLAGCTLIESSIDSPFVAQKWNYTLPTLDPGQYQYFNASTRDQQYASGGSLPYQKAFYVVLFAVFIMDVVVLAYFLYHKDWYTDFSEPNALFTLAVNSPPSDKLAGSCGCGPCGAQYKVGWKLNNNDGHFFVESRDEMPYTSAHQINIRSPRMSRTRFTQSFEMMSSPVDSFKKRFSPQAV